MLKDFIVLKDLDAYSDRSNKLSKEDVEELDNLPKLPEIKGFIGSREHAVTIIRCDSEQGNAVSKLACQGLAEILGEVIDNKYVFISETKQLKYEKLRKVGAYREYLPSFHEDGSIVLDENYNTVKVRTAHPYMFGLFA